MSTSHDLVTRLAKLARLNLTPKEAEAFSEQIPKILTYVEQLSTVDTTGLAAEPPTVANLRPDVVQPSARPDDILARAPERLDRYWKVPPVK